MNFKKTIMFSAIPIFSLFSAFNIINTPYQVSLDENNEFREITKLENNEQKSMEESMRERGDSEIIINVIKEMMEKNERNMDDWIVVE